MPNFVPTEICIIPAREEHAIVARDDAGTYGGVIVPSAIRLSLEQFAKHSSPLWVRHWKAYAATRGGDVFFWDLITLFDSVEAARAIGLDLRRLLRFSSAHEAFHAAWQARLMHNAAFASLQPKFDVPPERGLRFGDFVLDRLCRVELKTITRIVCLRDTPEGLRLPDDEITRPARNIREKAYDAIAQVGLDGT